MPHVQAFANTLQDTLRSDINRLLWHHNPINWIVQQSHNLQPLKGVAVHRGEAVQVLFGKRLTPAFPVDLQSAFRSSSHERVFVLSHSYTAEKSCWYHPLKGSTKHWSFPGHLSF